MTGGETQGVNLGDKFSVVMPGKTIKNPQTGLQLELPGKKIAQISVVKFVGQGDNALSYVEVDSGAVTKAQLNKVVIRELKD